VLCLRATTPDRLHLLAQAAPSLAERESRVEKYDVENVYYFSHEEKLSGRRSGSS